MSRGKVLGGSSAISLMGVGLTSAVEYDRGSRFRSVVR